MILNKDQKAQFDEAAGPLIKFLAQNYHPHVTVIVTGTSAELVEGVTTHRVPYEDCAALDHLLDDSVPED